MPDRTTTTRLNDPVSGDRAEQLATDLQHQKSRLAIKDVVEEYIGSSSFADRIKTIQLEALESTVTYKKISDKVGNQIDSTLSDRNLKNRNFVIPNLISAGAVVVAIVAVIVAIYKP